MPVIALHEIEDTTKRALVLHGATDSVAANVARAVRTAEANGNKICGLYYLESYCQQLRTGRVDGSAQPEVSTDRPGAVRVDGKFGFAQQAFAAGFDAAKESATVNGICGFSVEHTHTCTSLGYFTEQFAEAGFLAIGATNATPYVAPPGGSVPVLGTNPIAMAVPDGSGGVAFQFDFSTSVVALGKITMAKAAGESIPEGWALDDQGRSTTDPTAAMAGSLESAGGYKGYGISLMVEVLAAALTGSRLSSTVAPLKTPEGPHHDLGQFYLVIDPAAFSGEVFYDRLRSLAESVESQPGARLPGSTATSPESVELDEKLWQSVQILASGQVSAVEQP